jgi:glycosyltransferase involved in cell wall biosynthesis
MDSLSVSVIIPTVGRPAVRAAVDSVLKQTSPTLEIIVVVDTADCSIPPALQGISHKIRLLYAGGVGPSRARMQGIAAARGQVVAFLDDDDEWIPEKMERQLAIWPTGPEARAHTLMSCRYSIMDRDGRALKTLPRRLLAGNERVAAYLFRRSSISSGEGTLHPSTLMCDRALIDVEPWELIFMPHEDWDWVLRVGGRSDVAIRMCPDVLVRVAAVDERSLSRTGDWRLSLRWLEQRADQLTPRERGDFLLCHTASMAFRAGSRRAGFLVARRALSSARPGYTAWVVWGMHMVSPRLLDHASTLLSRVTQGRLRPTRRSKPRSPADPRADLPHRPGRRGTFAGG